MASNNCSECGKVYTSTSNLYKHMRLKHNFNGNVSGKSIKCNEPDCDCTFQTIGNLRKHLEQQHQLEFPLREENFQNYNGTRKLQKERNSLSADFCRWKEELENSSNVRFVKHRMDRVVSSITISQYYCSRSGLTKSTSRPLKRRPRHSSKCNNHCTAHMTLYKEEDDRCYVKYVNSHYNHTVSAEHVRLSYSDKHFLASQLKLGVPPKKVLANIHDGGVHGERIQLTKASDLRNIAKSFSINENRNDNNDNNSDNDTSAYEPNIEIDEGAPPINSVSSAQNDLTSLRKTAKDTLLRMYTSVDAIHNPETMKELHIKLNELENFIKLNSTVPNKFSEKVKPPVKSKSSHRRVKKKPRKLKVAVPESRLEQTEIEQALASIHADSDIIIVNTEIQQDHVYVTTENTDDTNCTESSFQQPQIKVKKVEIPRLSITDES